MLPRIRLWFERPLSGRGGALALGIRTGADGGVSCWPPPEKTGVPGRSSFPPGTPTSSSTVWFTSCWEALPSCHDKLLHAADMDPAPRTGVTWPGEALPPPSGSLRAPAIWVRAGSLMLLQRTGSLTSSSALALSGQGRASPAQSSPLPHAWPGFSSPCYLADLAHALPS